MGHEMPRGDSRSPRPESFFLFGRIRETQAKRMWFPVWVFFLIYKTVKKTADDAKFYVALTAKVAKLRIP